MTSKSEYEGFIEKVLEEWRGKINDLEGTVKPEMTQEVGYQKAMDFLKAKQQQAETRFEALKSSSEDWESLKSELDVSLDELRHAFERASSSIR